LFLGCFFSNFFFIVCQRVVGLPLRQLWVSHLLQHRLSERLGLDGLQPRDNQPSADLHSTFL
jgi:hypothetical protein